MEKPEASWRKNWGRAIEDQIGILKEDPWKFNVKNSKEKLQYTCDAMKKARLRENLETGNFGESESEIEISCLKNFEEAIKYIKNYLADFSRHSEAFALAQYQNYLNNRVIGD